MSTSERSNSWKWTALILGGLIGVSLICLVGCVLGGVIGFSLGMREGARTYPPGPGFMIPPDFPDSPERPGRPDLPDLPELPDTPGPELSGPPWLGVTFMSTADGAQISHVVPGSPADEAGIRVGDLIAKVDGRAVTLARPLSDVVSRYRAGDQVVLTILRNTGEIELTVTLGERPGYMPDAP